MARRKTGVRYDTVKIPNGLTAKIDWLIQENGHDFTSRTDVIKFAVRLLVRDTVNTNLDMVDEHALHEPIQVEQEIKVAKSRKNGRTRG